MQESPAHPRSKLGEDYYNAAPAIANNHNRPSSLALEKAWGTRPWLDQAFRTLLDIVHQQRFRLHPESSQRPQHNLGRFHPQRGLGASRRLLQKRINSCSTLVVDVVDFGQWFVADFRSRTYDDSHRRTHLETPSDSGATAIMK